MKKLISIILAVAVIFALNITAFAGGFITDESAMSTGAKADPPYAAAADDNAILKEKHMSYTQIVLVQHTVLA